MIKKALRRLRGVLLRVAKVIGRVNTFVLLTVSFYCILLPLSLMRRTVTRRREPSGWLRRKPLAKKHFSKQY